jgi:hypothetical protein
VLVAGAPQHLAVGGMAVGVGAACSKESQSENVAWRASGHSPTPTLASSPGDPASAIAGGAIAP